MISHNLTSFRSTALRVQLIARFSCYRFLSLIILPPMEKFIQIIEWNLIAFDTFTIWSGDKLECGENEKQFYIEAHCFWSLLNEMQMHIKISYVNWHRSSIPPSCNAFQGLKSFLFKSKLIRCIILGYLFNVHVWCGNLTQKINV